MTGVRIVDRMDAVSSKGRTVLAATGLGIGGYAFAAVVVGVASLLLIVAGIPLTERPTLLLAVSTVMGQGVAFGGFALAYLRYTDRSLDFINVRVPTLRDVAWSVGGLLALLAGLVAISVAFGLLGVESATNTVEQYGEQDPRAFLFLIPMSFLFIGPGEELLYRGVVQSRLREVFGPGVAIGVASLIFAVIHVFSLQGQGKLAYLATLFVLSLILGVAYESTENLVVPSLVHGAFNAVQFYSLYVTATGGLGVALL